jgi:hypothetical protein
MVNKRRGLFSKSTAEKKEHGRFTHPPNVRPLRELRSRPSK